MIPHGSSKLQRVHVVLNCTCRGLGWRYKCVHPWSAEDGKHCHLIHWCCCFGLRSRRTACCKTTYSHKHGNEKSSQTCIKTASMQFKQRIMFIQRISLWALIKGCLEMYAVCKATKEGTGTEAVCLFHSSTATKSFKYILVPFGWLCCFQEMCFQCQHLYHLHLNDNKLQWNLLVIKHVFIWRSQLKRVVSQE